MTYGTIKRTAERVDDFWMSRTPRQFLIWICVYYPLAVLACMYAMAAVTA